MSVFDEWADFARPIYKAQKLIYQQRRSWNQDGKVPLETMDSLRTELNFLYAFVGYTHMWSSDAAFEVKTYLQHTLIHRFNRRTFLSKDPDLEAVLTSLLGKISLWKLEISVAYSGSLSTLSYQPQPTSRINGVFGWCHFYRSLQSNLRYLSEKESDDAQQEKSSLDVSKKQKNYYFDGPLRQQMKALQSSMNSLEWLVSSRYYDSSPWMENMRAHLGGKLVQVAHLCCLCWYSESVYKSRQQDVAATLSDLRQKMDPATPEFLEIALESLGHCDEKYSEMSISSFLYHLLDSVDQKDVLQKELVSLVRYLIQIPEMHDTDVHRILQGIKYAVAEARYLKGKYWGEHKTDFAVLFAKIWSLKAEIFIKKGGNVLIFSVKAHVQHLYEGCRFLEETSTPTNKNAVEDQILKIIERVPKQVQSLYQSSPNEDYLIHHKVSNLLFKSLVHIMLLKAKALLLKLLEDASVLLPLKHQIGILHEGLLFFMHSDINEPKEEVTQYEKLILADIEVVASGVIAAYRVFETEMGKNEAEENMKSQLFDLLEKVKHLKAKLKELYLQVPMFNLPKIPGLCFIQLLSQKLTELLSGEHDSIAHATHQIEVIRSDLEFILSRFQEMDECRDLHSQLADLGYQVEHVIDCMLGENKVVWQHILWLYHLSERIGQIKVQLEQNNILDDRFDINVPQSLMPVVSRVTTASNDVVIVGLNEEKAKIISALINERKKLSVVSIVGMPGIGKTTLANDVYCCEKVRCHFQIRAWCCVSQNFKERDLLFDILSQVTTITEAIRARSNADLHELLRKKLKGQRYLIVMDDMWSTKAWKVFKLSFPNDSKRSRILLTSRLTDLVSEISHDLHPLHPLSEGESWKLLKVKIFGEKECPEELLEIGQQIAKSCKGLPLAIGAIAGVLDRTCGKSQDLWKKIAESVSSRIVNDPETQCKEILDLSYNHLPNHLKVCLLYFGAFPEDKDILVQKLQWLWISEGFVSKSESKSLENLAEDYLMDLIGRSLVIVSRRRSNGKVKSCRVHDVVRDLCLLKATDDRFLHLISAKDEPYSSFDRGDYGVLYECFNTSNSITYDQYRLYFGVDREQFVLSRPSGPFVRSLIFSATTDTSSSRCSYDASFISDNFERLRVLDLESINMGNSFRNGIELLADLRYLAVCGDMESIPPSLSKLQNLVTFIVKGLKRKIVLPDNIWRMKNLRHLHVSNHAIFTLPNDKNERSSQLESLVSLSLPYFVWGEETNEIILKFPNLQKLKCVFAKPSDASMNMCWVPTFKSLCQLESLKISYHSQALNSGELNLPSSLKKLTLSKLDLLWNHISEIGELKKLEVLKFISCTFEESSWEMKEEFPELKYLELENPNIVHWDAYSESFPSLQQLVLRNCQCLEEVPSDFGMISTLEKIEVQQCRISVIDSVKAFVEYHVKLEIVINGQPIDCGVDGYMSN